MSNINHKTDAIRFRLIDVNDGVTFNKSWAEGYISALADYDVITEDEFEDLLGFVSHQ